MPRQESSIAVDWMAMGLVQPDLIRRVLPLLCVALIAVAAWTATTRYWLHNSDVPDSIGYAQASHQLARGQGLTFHDPHNRPGASYYTLYSFKVVRADVVDRYFNYPPGVPLLGAALETVSGNPAAIDRLVPLAAVALVLSTYTLGALLFDRWAGAWAALLLVLTSTFLMFATALWSEIPSAALLYGGSACVIGAAHVQRRGLAIGLCALGGLLIGATLFVRSSNLSIVPAVALLPLVVTSRRWIRSRVVTLVLVLALATGATFIFNAHYYGGPFTTAYTPVHGWYDQPAFALAYAFGPSFVAHGGWSVPVIGATLWGDWGWLLLLALVGAWRGRRAGWWLIGLALCALGPYLVYAFAAKGENARFVLGALPALALLIGAGVLVVWRRFDHLIGRAVLVLAVAITVLLPLPRVSAELNARNGSTAERITFVRQLAARTEPNAVLLSYVYNDTLAVYGGRSVLNYRQMPPYDPVQRRYRYDLFQTMLTNEVNWLLDQRVPVYFVRDSAQPLYGSDELLARHFRLAPVGDDLPLLRVERGPAN